MKLTDNIKSIIKKIKNGESLSDPEKHDYIMYSISDKNTGKMSNIPAISTSCLYNPYCIERQKIPGSACSECYAKALLENGSRETTAEKLKVNTLFYSNYEITEECIPLINSLILRLETCGEICNLLHIKNYIEIAKKNSHCTVVLWTKNIDLIDRIQEIKPKNMIIIFSELFQNNNWTEKQFFNFRKIHPAIDKLFIVFSGEYIKQNNIELNCVKKNGKKRCINCMLCYELNNTFIIREKLHR